MSELKGVCEQPEPRVVENRGYVYERVIEDMRARADMGLRKYGTYLQACNGRDGLRDAYEEVLDLAVYLRQVIDERLLPQRQCRKPVGIQLHDGGIIHTLEQVAARVGRRWRRGR